MALGTMTFGEDWGWGASKEVSKEMFDLYADAGGNFIDSANRYTNGTAEKFVGEFIAADRHHFVVTTKFSLFTRQGNPNFSGNHRKNMMQALESSLKALRTDFIDVYWLHAWDFMTPVEEVMRALDDMVRAGKVLYVAISDAPAWVVSRANMLAELRGWSSFIGLQARYSLTDRSAERDLLPMARELDLGVMAWSILGAGILTGKYSGDSAVLGRAADWDIDKRELAIADEVAKVAEEIGRSPSQVAINWVRQQPGVIIPIIGATKPYQLEDNLTALDFELDASQMARLDEVSVIDLGFPHDFLASNEIKNLVFGGTFDQIDNHRKR
jgi:aryl-alcohol dehydrogenase-like predicted oxidoreductase